MLLCLWFCLVKCFITVEEVGVEILTVKPSEVAEDVCKDEEMKIVEIKDGEVDKIAKLIKKYYNNKGWENQLYRVNKISSLNGKCADFLIQKSIANFQLKRLCYEKFQEFKVVCLSTDKPTAEENDTETVTTSDVNGDSEHMSTTTVVLFTVFATITVVTVCALILHFDVLHIRVSYCRSLKNWFFDYKINYYRLWYGF